MSPSARVNKQETGITQSQLDDLIKTELGRLKEEAKPKQAAYRAAIKELGDARDMENQLKGAQDAATEADKVGRERIETQVERYNLRREFLHAGGREQCFDIVSDALKRAESAAKFLEENPYLKEPDELPIEILNAIDNAASEHEKRMDAFVQKIPIAANIVQERARLKRTLEGYTKAAEVANELGEKTCREYRIKSALHRAYMQNRGIESAADAVAEYLYDKGAFDIDENGEITVTVNNPVYHNGELAHEDKQYYLADYVIAYAPRFAQRASRTRGTGSDPGISSDGIPRDESDGLRPGEADKSFAKKSGIWIDTDEL